MSLGHGKRKHFLGKTREEAARKLRATQKARDDGLPVIIERKTVGQFLTKWLT
jgi:hypothetical protein